MRPIRTPASNFVYLGDPDEGVGDLNCERVQPGEIASVWQLDDREREIIANGGQVRLTVHGEPIPPVDLEIVHASPEVT